MGTEINRGEHMAIGNVAGRGRAWWASEYEELHFDGSIPLDVAQRLIGWEPLQVPMTYPHPVTGAQTLFGEYVPNADATGMDYKGPMVVLRSDTLAPMGSNGGKSNLFSYWDWFMNGPKRLLDTSELNLGFVGTFNGGAQAAVQIELAKTIVEEKTGVSYRPFLYAASSIDGSLAAQYGMAYTRIVCENTFSMATKEAQRDGLFYKVRQTLNRKVDDNAAREALQLVHGMSDDITKELHAMCETTVTDKQWSAFLNAYMPMPEKDPKSKTGGRAYTTAGNTRDELTKMWNTDTRVAPWRNTVFGVSQAVTTWQQNEAIIRGANGRVARNKLNMISGKSTNVEAQALATLDKVLANA